MVQPQSVAVDNLWLGVRPLLYPVYQVIDLFDDHIIVPASEVAVSG